MENWKIKYRILTKQKNLINSIYEYLKYKIMTIILFYMLNLCLTFVFIAKENNNFSQCVVAFYIKKRVDDKKTYVVLQSL